VRSGKTCEIQSGWAASAGEPQKKVLATKAAQTRNRRIEVTPSMINRRDEDAPVSVDHSFINRMMQSHYCSYSIAAERAAGVGCADFDELARQARATGLPVRGCGAILKTLPISPEYSARRQVIDVEARA
jgi:hypothetical protein